MIKQLIVCQKDLYDEGEVYRKPEDDLLLWEL